MRFQYQVVQKARRALRPQCAAWLTESQRIRISNCEAWQVQTNAPRPVSHRAQIDAGGAIVVLVAVLVLVVGVLIA